MGSAYTPGLRVSARTTIDKTRRLPLKGNVVVKEGDRVFPDTVVARTELPGLLQTVKLAELMGIEPGDVKNSLLVKQGDTIEKGTLLAQSKGMFGLFKSEFKSPVAGVLELISEKTGNLGVRQAPTPIEKDAYITGRVTRVLPGEGVVVECEGALVQGIFGVGGERQGSIEVVATRSDDLLTDTLIRPEHKGKIVIGGSNVSLAALRRASLAVITRKTADDSSVARLHDAIRDAAPLVPRVVVRFVLGGLRDARKAMGGETRSLSALGGSMVTAIAGVADSDAFFRQLEQAGAIVTPFAFADHHDFSPADVTSVLAAIPDRDGVVVCTLKDAVKLVPIWPATAPPLWYVSQALEVESGGDALENLLSQAVRPNPKVDLKTHHASPNP